MAKCKFGTNFVYYSGVVAVFITVYHNQRVRVRLSEQVLRFVNFVCGVYRYENRPDFRRRPESNIPGRHVRRPDSNVIAAFNPHRNERASKLVDVVAELRIRAGVVEFGITKRVLFGEFFANAVENVRESLVYQRFFRPDVFAGISFVVLKRTRFFLVTRHIVGKLRHDDTCVAEFVRPPFYPFE